MLRLKLCQKSTHKWLNISNSSKNKYQILIIDWFELERKKEKKIFKQ